MHVNVNGDVNVMLCCVNGMFMLCYVNVMLYYVMLRICYVNVNVMLCYNGYVNVVLC